MVWEWNLGAAGKVVKCDVMTCNVTFFLSPWSPQALSQSWHRPPTPLTMSALWKYILFVYFHQSDHKTLKRLKGMCIIWKDIFYTLNLVENCNEINDYILQIRNQLPSTERSENYHRLSEFADLLVNNGSQGAIIDNWTEHLQLFYLSLSMHFCPRSPAVSGCRFVNPVWNSQEMY